MKNFKYLVVLSVIMLTVTSCGDYVSKKLTNCAQVAAMSAEYRQAGVAYLNDPSEENCAAYRKIAESYVAALEGCSTTAAVTLAAVKDVRAALDCSKKAPQKEE